MKNLLVITLSIFSFFAIKAEKYITKTGHISFYSEAPLENIEADNNQVTSILDTESGEMVFSVLMKGFQFEKALMQEHFNEKYIHSEKYPKSTFQGKIVDLSAVDFSKDGEYEVEVEGTLNLHGESKTIKSPGTLEVKDGEINANATFNLTVADYNIEIPSVVEDNIADVVEVRVKMNYKPFKK
ncbi:MAG: YceI family protein [Chitinophagales bacterium]